MCDWNMAGGGVAGVDAVCMFVRVCVCARVCSHIFKSLYAADTH